MKSRITIKQKILLHILLVSILISTSIVAATLLLSDDGRKVVLQGVTENLRQVQWITEEEFNRAKEMASKGIIEASGIGTIENILDITVKNQNAYYEETQEKIGQVAENVTATLNEQNQLANSTLDNLLIVSTDSMNRIMEFDNNSLQVLSNVAFLSLNNFNAISAESIDRITTNMHVHKALIKEMNVVNLNEINDLQNLVLDNWKTDEITIQGNSATKLIATLKKFNDDLKTRQTELFQDIYDDYLLESLVVAEELKLLTKKINYAIGQEVEYSAIIQDENIEQVIINLLHEKIKINEGLGQSSEEVKQTIGNLEDRLLSVLRERGENTQENITLQTAETKLLAEETKDLVASGIRRNTENALVKIDKTIEDSKNVIESALNSSSNKTVFYSILITAACAVLAMIASFFIINGITQPISGVVKFADRMSKGDLSERLPEGNDEVGVMGKALNTMANELVKLQQATLNSFNETLDQVIDCVFIFDPDTLLFSYVNQGAVLQIGYSREEIFHMTPIDIKPEYTQDSFLEMILPLKNGEVDTLFFSTVHKTKTGDIVPVEVLMKYVVPPGNDPRFVAIVRDITEKQKIQKENEMIQAQLLHAQKLESVGQLAAGIAHEINTPTQFIGTNVEFLEDAFNDFRSIIETIEKVILDAPDQISQKLKDALLDGDWEYLAKEIPQAIEQSREGVTRVSSIVGAMKKFSHPGSRNMKHNNLNAIIETTVIVASNEWKYVASIEKNLDPDLPKVPCLADEMGQVVLNLLVNAAHAIGKKLGENPDGEKGLIEISTKKIDDFIQLIVKDNGVGIPEDARARIFDPFFTTKEVGKGTGQGLAITHDVITQKHHGVIDFETEIGVGTSFILNLPLVVSDQSNDT